MFKKRRKRNKNREGIINHYVPCTLSSSTTYTLISYLQLKIASLLYHSVGLRYLITETERYSLYEINVSLEVSGKRPPTTTTSVSFTGILTLRTKSSTAVTEP